MVALSSLPILLSSSSTHLLLLFASFPPLPNTWTLSRRQRELALADSRLSVLLTCPVMTERAALTQTYSSR